MEQITTLLGRINADPANSEVQLRNLGVLLRDLRLDQFDMVWPQVLGLIENFFRSHRMPATPGTLKAFEALCVTVREIAHRSFEPIRKAIGQEKIHFRVRDDAFFNMVLPEPLTAGALMETWAREIKQRIEHFSAEDCDSFHEALLSADIPAGSKTVDIAFQLALEQNNQDAVLKIGLFVCEDCFKDMPRSDLKTKLSVVRAWKNFLYTNNWQAEVKQEVASAADISPWHVPALFNLAAICIAPAWGPSSDFALYQLPFNSTDTLHFSQFFKALSEQSNTDIGSLSEFQRRKLLAATINLLTMLSRLSLTARLSREKVDRTVQDQLLQKLNMLSLAVQKLFATLLLNLAEQDDIVAELAVGQYFPRLKWNIFAIYLRAGRLSAAAKMFSANVKEMPLSIILWARQKIQDFFPADTNEDSLENGVKKEITHRYYSFVNNPLAVIGAGAAAFGVSFFLFWCTSEGPLMSLTLAVTEKTASFGEQFLFMFLIILSSIGLCLGFLGACYGIYKLCADAYKKYEEVTIAKNNIDTEDAALVDNFDLNRFQVQPFESMDDTMQRSLDAPANDRAQVSEQVVPLVQQASAVR